MSVSASRCTVSTVAVLIAVVSLAAALFQGYSVPSYQGTDENGYLLTAKRLATQGEISKRTEGPNEFVGSNWVEARDDVYYAKYPIGYPLLCAIAYKIGGPSATFLVNPILAVLAVAGMFFLGRAMLGEFAGALAAILLATNPMHAYYGISALSHTGAVCFAIWGMYFVWRWAGHGGWWNAILGAGLTAFTTSVRYTEALLALPAFAMVVWRCVELCRTGGSEDGKDRRLDALPWAQLAVMIVVGIAVLSPLLIQHWVAYGSPFTSGYSLCGESTGFGWNWFEKNWRLMLNRMDTSGLFLLFPVGVAGLAYLVVHRPKLGTFLALWAIPSLLLYTAYYWAPEGDGPWYIRFFISIFPPLILGALALLCVAVPTRPAWNIAIGLFVLLAAGANLDEAERQLDRKTTGLLFAHALLDEARGKLPDGSVILSDEHILNFLEFAGTYELYATSAYDRGFLQKRTDVLKDDQPHPFHRQKARDLQKWLGNKTDSQLNALLADRLGERISEGRPVYLVTSQGGWPRWRGRLGDRFDFTLVDECVEAKPNPKGGVNVSNWSIYQLSPAHPDALAAAKTSRSIGEKVDQIRARIDMMKSEYTQDHPGAKEDWAKIADMEKQLRETQEELKRARQKEKALAQSH